MFLCILFCSFHNHGSCLSCIPCHVLHLFVSGSDLFIVLIVHMCFLLVIRPCVYIARSHALSFVYICLLFGEFCQVMF